MSAHFYTWCNCMLAINHDAGERYTIHLSKASAQKQPNHSKAVNHKSNLSHFVFMVTFLPALIIYIPVA